MKRDIKSDYRGWRFWDKVRLIPREEQWKNYFDSKFDNIEVDVHCDCDCGPEFDPNEIIEPIENKIDTSVETLENDLNEKLCKVHKHIEDAEQHLCCDICCAKNDIKNHIDEKIEPIMEFETNFSDLNAQVQEILNRI